MSGLERGVTLGRYEVIRELGRGGMGAVYLVRQSNLGGLFALKVVECPGSGLRRRILEEGRSQAMVRHPNVVLMVDILELDDGLGLVMEYVNGPTLAEWLMNRELDLDDALTLFNGVLQGVEAAHLAGLVHRDIKPSNILMAHGYPMPVPKVADFGLVKQLDNDAASLTRSGVMMGTVGWMAPEQSEDASRVDQRADIYSLGCILYRLVCGRGPFEGMSNLAFLNASHRGTWTRPAELSLNLPSAVSAAIEGCLQPDRERRIGSCAELRRVLGGEALPEPAPSASVGLARTWSDESYSAESSSMRRGDESEAPASMASLESPAPPESSVRSEETPPVTAPPANSAEAPAASAPSGGPTIVVPRVVVAPARPPAPRRGVPMFAVLFLGAAAALAVVVALPTGAPGPGSALTPPALAPSAEESAPVPKSGGGADSPRDAPVGPPPRTGQPPAKAAEARISVTKDDQILKICVQGETRCYVDGPIPPGTYPVWVTGLDQQSWQAGTVTVAPGEQVKLRCSSASRLCER